MAKRKRKKKRRAGARPRRRWLRRVLLAVALVGLAGALVLGAYSLYLGHQIDARFAGRRWSVPSRVFSDVTLIFPGQAITPARLHARLSRLGYRAVERAPARPGEYRHDARAVELHLRAATHPVLRRDTARVTVRFAGGLVEKIERSPGGEALPILELEPKELAQIFGEEERESRQLIAYDRLPRHLVHAVLAAEDADFFQHHGVDPTGILRALWVNLRQGSVRQGGSTITQQLAKNYFLSPERTLERKLRELLIAVIMEVRYDKETILEIYLNEIYLGQRGAVAVNGVGEAARFYFGRAAEQLSLSESATLAGLIRGPNLYSPHKAPTRAKQRRDQVLGAMATRGWIEQGALKTALASPVEPAPYAPYQRAAPYFFDHLYTQLRALYSVDDLQGANMSIYTTLDPEVQSAAERALVQGLERLERSRPALRRDDPARQLQGAVVVMRPRTGHILAMVGGRDYAQNQFNRAVQAKRQPGSLFKPFVVLAGLDTLHPGTPLSNEPASYDVGGKPWRPKNYDGSSGGNVRMRQALAESINLPIVDLAMRIGLEPVIATARELGITTPLEPRPSLALGAFEVVPLELARAYCALAADGALPYPLAVREVLGHDDAPIERRHARVEPRLTPAEAYVVTSFLRSAVTDGTGRGLAKLGVDFPVAGKTGTTSGSRDAWFVGYTPDLLALVWVGFDDGESVRASGSSAALPIWAELIKAIPWTHGRRWYDPPPGVLQAKVCSQSGKLAVTGCPEPIEELFLETNAPDEPCHLHRDRTQLQRTLDNLKGAFGL